MQPQRRMDLFFDWPVVAAPVALIFLLTVSCGGGGTPRQPVVDTTETPQSGGGLVLALRSEPTSFNPVFAFEPIASALMQRLHSDLIHVDRFTQRTKPALAKSWEVSDDGLRYTLTLRPDLRFSDGEPLTVEDVIFTYRVFLDETVAAPGSSRLLVDGQPIAVRAIDERRVLFELPKPHAAADRLLDGIPILPRHHLEGAYLAGELEQAWGLDADPSAIAGMGAFRLREVVAGDRIVLERNPHYWRRDDEDNALPYLDTLTFLIVPDRVDQVSRFQKGELHLVDRLSVDSFELLARSSKADRFRLEDLGPGVSFTMLFFNLNDLEPGSAHATEQRWFRQPVFRRAVSAAIDRKEIVDVVFSGRATPIASYASPGHKRWLDPALKPPRRSLARARDLLAGADFSWDVEGRLRDSGGERVAWSLVTNSSNEQRLRILTIVQANLAEIGITVQPTPMSFRTLLDRIYQSFDYAACVLAIGGGDADPSSQMGYLTSAGPQRLWRRSAESDPEQWQAEIDRLMSQQLVTRDFAERQRLVFEVQDVVAQNLPFIPLVSPHVLVGAQREVGNFRPAVLAHHTMWNADELYLRTTRAD